MKKDDLIIFVMAPVTNTNGRVFRSGRIDLQHIQRKNLAPPTRYNKDQQETVLLVLSPQSITKQRLDQKMKLR